MAADWRRSTLGQFVSLRRGHDLTEPERRPGNVPVMGSAGENGRHDTALAKGPGLVIGRSGASFGQVHFCADDYWPHNTALYVTDFHGNDPRFAYYFLKAINFARFNSGSAQPSLNRNFIHPIEVDLPGLTEQRAIAQTLGTLDEKIELNRRMNETLEAIARAIFKSWFVDFDPVRAKASGEPPESICRHFGLTPDLLALFPDRLIESELGKLPRGWQVGTLGQVADHPKRGVQPDEIEEDTPYIALEHMPRRSIALSEWESSAGIESNKFQFRKGELLFGKLRPYFHKVGVAAVDGVCSTDIVVIAPKSEAWFGFVLGHCSSDEFVEHTNAASTGTRMPRTNWSDMARYQFPQPPSALAGKFTDLVRPLVDRIGTAIHEVRALAAVRDALLPKLLSGELHVGEAGTIVKRETFASGEHADV